MSLLSLNYYTLFTMTRLVLVKCLDESQMSHVNVVLAMSLFFAAENWNQ